jgi:chromosomal replication initiation ATPase DnaA
MTEPPKIPLSAIVKAVGEHFGVGAKDLLGESRHASVIMPRHIIYYLAIRLIAHKSTTGISRELGRDHSTLIHGRDKVAKMRREIPELGAVIDQLEAKLRSGTYVDSRTKIVELSRSYIESQSIPSDPE